VVYRHDKLDPFCVSPKLNAAQLSMPLDSKVSPYHERS